MLTITTLYNYNICRSHGVVEEIFIRTTMRSWGCSSTLWFNLISGSTPLSTKGSSRSPQTTRGLRFWFDIEAFRAYCIPESDFDLDRMRIVEIQIVVVFLFNKMVNTAIICDKNSQKVEESKKKNARQKESGDTASLRPRCWDREVYT